MQQFLHIHPSDFSFEICGQGRMWSSP